MVHILIIKIPETEESVNTKDMQKKMQCVYFCADGHKIWVTHVQQNDNGVAFFSQ